jgi:hypothetical protein
MTCVTKKQMEQLRRWDGQHTYAAWAARDVHMQEWRPSTKAAGAGE